MTTEPTQPISVAILAGGHSRRMGTDKALLRLSPAGPTLVELVIDVARQLSHDIFLVSAERPGYRDFGVPVRPDLFGDTGAIGGVGSAIAHAENEFCLVVSCDMPFLNLDLAHMMSNRPRSYDALIPRLEVESRQRGPFTLQTMHAIYRKTCLSAIESALIRGERRVTSFLDDIHLETIEQSIIQQIDPDLTSFFSINTPESLAAARDLIARTQPKRG